jgi:signal transduction histidine kinase/CheY-like chemotaxis protein
MQKHDKEKNITIFTGILLFLAAAVAGGILYILQQNIRQSQELDQLITVRSYCDTAINDFMDASDYMTNEIWEYALDGNTEHMERYWYEVNQNRKRDKSIQKLLHENLSIQETSYVLRVKAYSDNLIPAETKSMRFMAESTGVKEQDMPAQVRALKLSYADESMTPHQKELAAQSLVFGTAYISTKQLMRTTIHSFHADLTARIETNTKESLQSRKRSARFGLISIMLLMGIMVITIIAYSIVVSRKNDQLQKALERAREASTAKSYFTARMSHEIRTPLNAVLGYMAIAKEEKDKSRWAEYLKKSETAAKSLLAIVNDVLDLSAIENRRMKLTDESFSVKQLLDNLHVVYDAQAQKKNLQFSVKTDSISREWLKGDAQRIRQILSNLLSNAIKFTPENGSVELNAVQEDDGKSAKTVFTVRDTGIGIKPEFMKYIFQPYEQADASISRKYGGSGLGLSIVKSMTELMGGTVSVESKPDQGTAFTVTLYNEITEIPETQENVSISAADNLTGMKLLLAEDNEMNSEIAQNILRNYGAEVTAVRNGKAAIEAFESSPPATFDAILMDIQMPEVDGYQAARHIRASVHPQAKTVPIIAMTANAFESDVQQALACGMNAHIGKPFDVQKLIGTVQKFRIR